MSFVRELTGVNHENKLGLGYTNIRMHSLRHSITYSMLSSYFTQIGSTIKSDIVHLLKVDGYWYWSWRYGEEEKFPPQTSHFWFEHRAQDNPFSHYYYCLVFPEIQLSSGSNWIYLRLLLNLIGSGLGFRISQANVKSRNIYLCV